ncbi:YqaA family protein [Kordiimonas sp. SCSIO 12610]|uniref:YqaA family protein n=1 Tax=Kordiimonas sp. SCSIO 12610 TaxID=2829597 RepID=UPI00210B0F6E|nr:YqaA family protein [Kordiimonas sp. SCSIO 12610]UTW54456.1 DedA family protein [Kordiimonas sp. SCSIO 12610]
MEDIAVYWALFLNAFIAATLLPAFSELALSALLIEDIGEPVFLLLAATTGNILGSVVNWLLGKFIIVQDKIQTKYATKTSFKKAKGLFERFGVYSLLFAWAPIIGDPLTFIAGIFKIRFLPFIILVSIGKFMRYSLILLAISYT